MSVIQCVLPMNLDCRPAQWPLPQRSSEGRGQPQTPAVFWDAKTHTAEHSCEQQVGVVRQLIHRSKWAEIHENTAKLLAMQEPTLQSFQRSLT